MHEKNHLDSTEFTCADKSATSVGRTILMASCVEACVKANVERLGGKFIIVSTKWSGRIWDRTLPIVGLGNCHLGNFARAQIMAAFSLTLTCGCKHRAEVGDLERSFVLN